MSKRLRKKPTTIYHLEDIAITAYIRGKSKIHVPRLLFEYDIELYYRNDGFIIGECFITGFEKKIKIDLNDIIDVDACNIVCIILNKLGFKKRDFSEHERILCNRWKERCVYKHIVLKFDRRRKEDLCVTSSVS